MIQVENDEKKLYDIYINNILLVKAHSSNGKLLFCQQTLKSLWICRGVNHKGNECGSDSQGHSNSHNIGQNWPSYLDMSVSLLTPGCHEWSAAVKQVLARPSHGPCVFFNIWIFNYKQTWSSPIYLLIMLRERCSTRPVVIIDQNPSHNSRLSQ